MSPDTLINLTAILAFFGLVVFWGRRSQKKPSSPSEYFLSSRSLKWPVIGLSLFATNTSSIQLVGQTGMAYKIGIAAANPQLIGAFLLGFSAIFFVPIYLRLQLFTIPAFLEYRFGKSAKIVFSFITVSIGFWATPCLLYAGGVTVLGTFGFSHDYLLLVSIILCLCVGMYSIYGGLRSVAITDCIQGSVILIGCVILLCSAFLRIGGWEGIQDNLNADQFELMLPSDNKVMPWTGVFSGLLVASVFFSAANMDTLQRVLGASSIQQAQRGMFLAAGLKILALLLIVIPGVFVSAILPDIAPDTAFGTMIKELLPVGLSGIMIAALIAAVMSSIDSSMLSTSTIVAVEIFPWLKPKATDGQRLRVGYATSLFLLVWSCLAVPLVDNFELIFLFLLKASALILMPAAVCFLGGRFSKTVNEFACLCVMLGGYATGLVYFAMTTFDNLRGLLPLWFLDIHFYHVSAGLAVIYAIALFICSQFGSPPKPESLAILITPEPPRPIKGMKATTLFAGLAILIAGLYLWF